MRKLKIFKNIFIIFIFCLSSFGLARFCHHHTKGFKLTKIHNNTTCLENQPSPPLPSTLRFCLGQKFHYLGRGLQSFCFLSEEGEVVLKIFNNQHQSFLAVPFLNNWLKNKASHHKKRWKELFESYDIASRVLNEETCLLYLHPQKCPDTSLQVTLIDPIGIHHKVQLNALAFALQRKATMAYPYFNACGIQNDSEKAKEGLKSLVNLLRTKMDKGVADADSLIRTNFGFYQDKAVEVDIGAFYLDPSLKNPATQKEKVYKITESLKNWLENNHPQFVNYLNEAIENSTN